MAEQESRYERKFVIDNISHEGIEMIIKQHHSMFREIYQGRYINNIYLDTYNFLFYLDNNFGKSRRKKVRIRWYGSLFGDIQKPVLEYKLKSGAVGDKLSFQLAPFRLNGNFSLAKLKDVISKSDLPHWVVEDIACLEPKLLNRYRRKYFLSWDKQFRTTIDSELGYHNIATNNNSFMKSEIDNKNYIVELKYKFASDKDAEKVTNGFPFRLTKSSKYVNGIEKFHLNIAV